MLRLRQDTGSHLDGIVKPGQDSVTVVAVLVAAAASVLLCFRLRTVRIAMRIVVRIASQILMWALLGVIALLVITRLAVWLRAYWVSGM